MNKPLRVLVVDDAPEIVTVLTGLFQSEGFVVESALSADEAVARYSEAQNKGDSFSLISLDIRMPNIDGMHLAKNLRELGFTGPMIAFTANASLAGKKTSKEVGINAYFNKSVMNRDLIRALKDQFCG
jgi:two-component system CheB/CheR fusion protein